MTNATCHIHLHMMLCRIADTIASLARGNRCGCGRMMRIWRGTYTCNMANHATKHWYAASIRICVYIFLSHAHGTRPMTHAHTYTYAHTYVTYTHTHAHMSHVTYHWEQTMCVVYIHWRWLWRRCFRVRGGVGRHVWEQRWNHGRRGVVAREAAR